ncbi:MAG: arginine repressor [Firmicutes bacterium]|nr:arginine repressor [Bacillota bacterium]MDD4264509.1 arginine repressor [Bacillota bacterium]MDD4693919.1 arginine repressor [Bacillota bacterium]
MKSKRQTLIIELIKKEALDTQEQLAERLRQMGIDVTQATVSRDVKELRLIKVAVGDGRYRYAPPPDTLDKPEDLKRARRIFQEAVLNIDSSLNLVVIKTLAGTAQGVAAVIDDMGITGILATVAGDDSILCVVKPIEAVFNVIQDLEGLRS